MPLVIEASRRGKLLVPSILCAAAAASCAGLHAQDRASVLRYASLQGNIRGELHMLPPVSTGPSQVQLDGSGWIAVRALGPPSPLVADSYAFAQTSPVWVVAGNSEYRSADDIRFLLEAVQAFRDRVVARDRWVTAADRERFLARVDEAVAAYEGLLRELEAR